MTKTESPKEEWRDIVEGVYQVSSLGRIRRWVKSRVSHKGKILTPHLLRGYPKVTLSTGGRNNNRRIHQWVAEAFLGPCPPGLVIDHIDGNKQNNSYKNLEYVTRAENTRRATVNGLMTRGETNSIHALTEAQVRFIFLAVAEGIDQRTLAKLYGVNDTTISDIVLRRTWRHIDPDTIAIAAPAVNPSSEDI